MVEKLVEMGTLFEFYGSLLSERQYLTIELYYVHDLSLGEIGEELNITRQGVFDSLKRAETNLYKFEETLGLVRKFHKNHDNIKRIMEISLFIRKIAEDNNIKDIILKTEIIDEIVEKILDGS